tara:strand:- start:10988 stop:11914 length:927 start_codon:yes stop_codon:yes gene_type:complete
MVALYNTEQTTLSQKGGYIGEDVTHTKTMEQQNLLQDLIQGRITLEVMNLRWRMYKVLEASANALATRTVNEKGEEAYKVTYIDRTQELRKVKTDDNTYPLEMVIDNSLKSKGVHQTLDTKAIKSTDKTSNKMEEEQSAVLGEITAEEYFSHIKGDIKIKITRDFTPKFEIEKYAKKLNVKKIDNENKVLEFYISKYPIEHDRKSTVLLNQIQKIDANPRASTLIDFNSVSFITYNDLGVGDNLRYEFDGLRYIQTTEFDGNYVLKFMANIVTNGESQVEEFRMEELDKKYEMKEVREESSTNYTLYV